MEVTHAVSPARLLNTRSRQRSEVATGSAPGRALSRRVCRRTPASAPDRFPRSSICSQGSLDQSIAASGPAWVPRRGPRCRPARPGRPTHGPRPEQAGRQGQGVGQALSHVDAAGRIRQGQDADRAAHGPDGAFGRDRSARAGQPWADRRRRR